MVVNADDNGGLVAFSTIAGARVGRWCTAASGEVPDRCYNCWDPDTLLAHPAEGYVEERAEDDTVWRHGICHRCRPEITK